MPDLYRQYKKKKPFIPNRDERPYFRGTTQISPNSALSTFNGVTRQTLLMVQAAAHEGKPPISGRRSQQPRPLCSRYPIFDNSIIDFSYSAIF